MTAAGLHGDCPSGLPGGRCRRQCGRVRRRRSVRLGRSLPLAAPIAGMAATTDGGGYWLASADGRVFAYGDAGFHGSMGGRRLNGPIVGIAATADGGGYWLVAADGGVFAFGDAAIPRVDGRRKPLNAPRWSGSRPRRSGRATGWWPPTAGCSPSATPLFHGSRVASHLDRARHRHRLAGRRWLLVVSADGGVFAYDAPFLGSMGGKQSQRPRGRHGGHAGRGWLLAGRIGRWGLQLRGCHVLGAATGSPGGRGSWASPAPTDRPAKVVAEHAWACLVERHRCRRTSRHQARSWRHVNENGASELEPERRFELLTCALRVRCSTD